MSVIRFPAWFALTLNLSLCFTQGPLPTLNDVGYAAFGPPYSASSDPSPASPAGSRAIAATVAPEFIALQA